MRTWDKSKPPTGPFALNRDAPQAENLVAWYPLGGAGKLWVPDYAGPNHLTLGTDPGLTVGQAGAPVLPLVAASSQYLEGVIAGASTLPLTLAGWCKTTSTGSLGVPICVGTNGGNARLQIQKDTSTRQIGAAIVNSAGSGNTISFTTSSSYTDNVDFHAAAVYTSSTSRQAFLNGIGSSVDTMSITASGMDRVLLGGRRNSSSVGAFWGGHLGEWGVWAQADDATMIALRADPGSRFELWYPLRSKRWISLASGGNYTAAIAESTAFADSASSQAALGAAASEAALLSSAQDAVVGRFATTAEAMALVDTANRSFGATGVAIEAVALDATHVAAYAATAVVSESMSLGDSKACGYAAIATTTESMALADTGNGALAGGAFSAGISEAVTLSHTKAELYGATATASDGVSLADIGSNVAALGSTASDALTLDAIASSGGAFGAASVAALDLADARAAAMSAVSSATDAMALTDARVSQLALSAALITQILLAEIAAATNSGGGEVTVIAGSITRPARDQESTRTTRNEQSDRTRRVQSGSRPARIG